MAIVGRLPVRRTLDAALDRVAAGGSWTVALAGEPGIGKTTMVGWASLRARERAWQVLHGRAAEYEHEVAFGVIVDALDDCLASVVPGRLANIGGQRAAELAAVFPALARQAPPAVVGTPAQRHRFHYAVRALLEELSRERPLLIGLDDLHWADHASIELLAHLLRRPPLAPVLTLVSFRPQYLPRLLIDALATAAREQQVEVVEIGPLTADEIGQLIADVTEPALRMNVHHESGGNPFYALQLARAATGQAIQAASVPVATRELVGVPPSVRVAIEQELSGLSNSAMCVLWAAAVAGDPFDVDVAAGIAALPGSAALRDLDAALERELIRVTETPWRYEFRHPIVRRAVYESIPMGWRLQAHTRAAELLTAAGRPVTSVAPHVERSATRGDESAIGLLRAAGDAAARRAPAAAARWYAAALRLAGDTEAAPAVRIPLLKAVSAALCAEGRFDESRERLAEALAALSDGERARRGALAADLAHLDLLRGHPQDGRRVLLAALASRPTPAAGERAELLLDIAFNCWVFGDHVQAVGHAAEALQLAGSLGGKALVGAAHALLSLTEARAGRLEVAEEHRAAAEAALDLLPDEEVAERLDGLNYLSRSSHDLGHWRAAIRHAERGLALSLGNRRSYLFCPLIVTLGTARLRVGEVRDAERNADEALESALLLREGAHLAWASTLRAWVALERDDLGAAIRDGERAAALLPTTSAGVTCFLTLPVLAEAYLAAGAPERARAHLLAGGPALDNLPPNRRAWTFRLLTQAELALGRLRAARAWAEQAEQSAADLNSAEARAHAAWTHALCDLVGADPTNAMRGALVAANQLDELNHPLDAASARIDAARALLAANQPEQANELLTAVYFEATGWGATRIARLATVSGRRIVQRPAGRPDLLHTRAGGLGVLTPREREVAVLVAQGATNREIAAELHLSVRTIETYVSHTLDKLGVRTRAAVAAIASSQEPPRPVL